MDLISKLVLTFMVIGGLNCGLIGAFNFDLIAFLFGSMSVLTRSIYLLIGLSAVWFVIEAIYPTQEFSK